MARYSGNLYLAVGWPSLALLVTVEAREEPMSVVHVEIGEKGNQTEADASILARNRKRVAPIDETHLTEEETKVLEERRAYNRKCAAKARKRSKDLISTLQEQVKGLTKDKMELQRKNEVMQAKLDLLEKQNRTLLMSQRQPPADGNTYFLNPTLQGIPVLEALTNHRRLVMPGDQMPLVTNAQDSQLAKPSGNDIIEGFAPTPKAQVSPASQDQVETQRELSAPVDATSLLT